MNPTILYEVAALVGLNALARLIRSDQLLVLCYHGVCGEQPDVSDADGLHVPVGLFEEQMGFLIPRYKPVSLKQVQEHFTCGAALPRRAVLVTFDDGYRNVARRALPVLRRMKIPCVLFPVAGLVEAGKWLWTSELEWRRGDNPDFARLRNLLKRLAVDE